MRQVLEGGCGYELKGLYPKNDNHRGPGLESLQPNWGPGSGSFSGIPRGLCRDLIAWQPAGQSANSDTVRPQGAIAVSDQSDSEGACGVKPTPFWTMMLEKIKIEISCKTEMLTF